MVPAYAPPVLELWLLLRWQERSGKSVSLSFQLGEVHGGGLRDMYFCEGNGRSEKTRR